MSLITKVFASDRISGGSGIHSWAPLIDSIVVGYYRGKDLIYVVRVRNGFVPATRRMVYEKLKPLITDRCPFVNLPETGRTLSGTFISGSTVLCSIVRLR